MMIEYIANFLPHRHIAYQTNQINVFQGPDNSLIIVQLNNNYAQNHM